MGLAADEVLILGRVTPGILNQMKIVKIQVHFKVYIAFFDTKNNMKRY